MIFLIDPHPYERSHRLLIGVRALDRLVGLAWLSRLGFPAPGNAKAVVKASLGQVPIFGWALRLSEFVFLARSWERDQQRFVSALRSLGTFRATGHPLWLILFPEGSRLTSDKLANSQKYSRVNGFPVFDHVLLPRFKGFQALMPELRRHIEYVVDGTLIFDGPKPSMTTVMNGTADIVIHVNIRKYPVAEIPEDEQAMQDWLLQRWVEKESLIAGFLRDPLSLGPPCDPERDAPPSVAPLYTLFAIFVSLAIPILYAVSQIENGMRNLMIANLAIVVMVGGFIASNLRPSRKGKQS